MRKSVHTIDQLDSVSLAELFRSVSRVRLRTLFFLGGILLAYTTFMHDWGAASQRGETAISIRYPFDLTLIKTQENESERSLKGVFFRIPDDLPIKKGKVDLKLMQQMNDPEQMPIPVGIAHLEASDQPTVMWHQYIAGGLFSIIAPAGAQESFNWEGHQQSRDFYERVSSANIVRRYYSDGWVLEYRVDERGFAVPGTLSWIQRRR